MKHIAPERQSWTLFSVLELGSTPGGGWASVAVYLTWTKLPYVHLLIQKSTPLSMIYQGESWHTRIAASVESPVKLASKAIFYTGYIAILLLIICYRTTTKYRIYSRIFVAVCGHLLLVMNPTRPSSVLTVRSTMQGMTETFHRLLQIYVKIASNPGSSFWFLSRMQLPIFLQQSCRSCETKSGVTGNLYFLGKSYISPVKFPTGNMNAIIPYSSQASCMVRKFRESLQMLPRPFLASTLYEWMNFIFMSSLGQQTS